MADDHNTDIIVSDLNNPFYCKDTKELTVKVSKIVAFSPYGRPIREIFCNVCKKGDQPSDHFFQKNE